MSEPKKLPWWKRLGKAAYEAILKEVWEILIGNKTKIGAAAHLTNQATLDNDIVRYVTLALMIIGAIHALYRSWKEHRPLGPFRT